jgi:hypothetical protein
MLLAAFVPVMVQATAFTEVVWVALSLTPPEATSTVVDRVPVAVTTSLTTTWVDPPAAIVPKAQSRVPEPKVQVPWSGSTDILVGPAGRAWCRVTPAASAVPVFSVVIE